MGGMNQVTLPTFKSLPKHRWFSSADKVVLTLSQTAMSLHAEKWKCVVLTLINVLQVQNKAELAVQKFFREDPNPKDALIRLKSTFGIDSVRHPKFPNLVLLKYDQRLSPLNEPIVQDCRGVIIDEQKNWEVVAMAFRRFFNYKEAGAAEIDWSTALVQEKLDGSLLLLYPYAGGWHVATSGMPDGAGSTKIPKKTIADVFWETFRDSGMTPPSPDCETCFFFELTGPANKQTIDYGVSGLTVLGCRSLTTLEEAPPLAAAALLLCPSPDFVAKTYPFSSIQEMTAAFQQIDPARHEGFVVVDARWNRVKAKHPGYVALRYAGSVDRLAEPRQLVSMTRSANGPEVLASFPHLADAIADAARRYDALVAAVAADATRLAGMTDGAAFAAEAGKTRWGRALEELRDGRAATAREAVDRMKLAQLVKLLGYE